MSTEKSYIKEVAESAEAYQTARAEPIPAQPRQSMDFIRSLMLDIPIQVVGVTETNKSTHDVQDYVKEIQGESLDSIKKLAGIK